MENTNPNARPGEFSDTSNIDRFELSNEEYESKSGMYARARLLMTDTVLAHLKAHKLGRFAATPDVTASSASTSNRIPPEVVVGSRCEVHASEGRPARRGIVRFVGEASIGKGGIWVGVQLDEPVGNGDGE